jgi:hypothetical protein
VDEKRDKRAVASDAAPRPACTSRKLTDDMLVMMREESESSLDGKFKNEREFF